MIRNAAALMLIVCAWIASPSAADEPAGFVGAEACAGCHAEEASAWHGSQHDQAMQAATPATVLGDFADASITQYGVTSRFYRNGRTISSRPKGRTDSCTSTRSTTRSASTRCSNI